jgi:hypothetical protein
LISQKSEEEAGTDRGFAREFQRMSQGFFAQVSTADEALAGLFLVTSFGQTKEVTVSILTTSFLL